MKKSAIIWIVIGVVIILATVFCIISNNKMVTKQVNIRLQADKLEFIYKRRADMIPGLINAVKGYAMGEGRTFSDMITTRIEMKDLHLDPLNSETMLAYDQSQQKISAAFDHLIGVSENYPELLANTRFVSMIDEIYAVQKRITTERAAYNLMVEQYNGSIKSFPNSIVASINGFKPRFGYHSEVILKPVPVEEPTQADSTSVQ